MFTQFIEFDGVGGEKKKGEVIRTVARLKRLARKLKKVTEVAVDSETNTLRVRHPGEMKLVGLSFCFGENQNYYIPTNHFFDDKQLPVEVVVKYLKPIFDRTDITIICHNLIFDRHVLANIGIEVATKHIFDTMVARFDTDVNMEKGLKGMTKQIYGVEQDEFKGCLATVTAEQKKAYGLKASNKAPFELVSIDVGAPYATADTYWTWRHYVDWCMDELEENKQTKLYHKVRMPFSTVLYNMERRGICINEERLQAMQIKAKSDLDDLEFKVIELAGVHFNVGSSQQVGELLFGHKKVNKQGVFSGNSHILEHSFDFPIESKTAGGAPSTGTEALKSILKKVYKKDRRKQTGQEMIRVLLKYKRLMKLKSVYMDGLLEQVYSDGKIHCGFNICGTESGRLSSSQPKVNWAVA